MFYYSSKCLNRHFLNWTFYLFIFWPEFLFGSWGGFSPLISKHSHNPGVLTFSGSDSQYHHLGELTSKPHNRGMLSGPRRQRVWTASLWSISLATDLPCSLSSAERRSLFPAEVHKSKQTTRSSPVWRLPNLPSSRPLPVLPPHFPCEMLFLCWFGQGSFTFVFGLFCMHNPMHFWKTRAASSLLTCPSHTMRTVALLC